MFGSGYTDITRAEIAFCGFSDLLPDGTAQRCRGSLFNGLRMHRPPFARFSSLDNMQASALFLVGATLGITLAGSSAVIFLVGFLVTSFFQVYFGGLCFSVESRKLKESQAVSPMPRFARTEGESCRSVKCCGSVSKIKRSMHANPSLNPNFLPL